MIEPRLPQTPEDWGVLLQSVPSKRKKEIVKRLDEIFGLDKKDAEQILSNMPLILIDNVSPLLASRIKKYFQALGAVVETTNHDMIKKNCFQIGWGETPDLSFFMKEEAVPASAPIPEKQKATEKPAKIPETPKAQEIPAPVPYVAPAPVIVPTPLPVVPEPVAESPAIVAKPQPVIEEKPVVAPISHVDSDWERRAQELNEKLKKIQDEKQQLHETHAEVTEKVKTEFHQKLEQEKQKSDEIAKAYQDLQAHAQKQEALTLEGAEWRTKAMALGEKVRELETELMQKISAIEHLIQQKDDLSRQSDKAAELASRVTDLEGAVAAKEGERATLQNRFEDLEKNISASQLELENFRGREHEWSQKAGGLEREAQILQEALRAKEEERAGLHSRISDLENKLSAAHQDLDNFRRHEQGLLQKIAGLERELQDMKAALQTRDAALAQFEKQMLELAENVRGYEALRQEHAQLVHERATIRREYDAKLVEQEVRLAKLEEEHRRHRSRVDRKNAAATRELGEWVRGVDTVRQGLQKLILFLGSESAVLDPEKKFPLRSPLTRGPDAPNNPEKS